MGAIVITFRRASADEQARWEQRRQQLANVGVGGGHGGGSGGGRKRAKTAAARARADSSADAFADAPTAPLAIVAGRCSTGGGAGGGLLELPYFYDEDTKRVVLEGLNVRGCIAEAVGDGADECDATLRLTMTVGGGGVGGGLVRVKGEDGAAADGASVLTTNLKLTVTAGAGVRTVPSGDTSTVLRPSTVPRPSSVLRPIVPVPASAVPASTEATHEMRLEHRRRMRVPLAFQVVDLVMLVLWSQQ
jgi:hypothetical protein